MSKFNLEAAKRGEPILFDGKPAAFIAHVQGNEPAYRVVISLCGRVRAFTEDGRYIEDGEVCLSMAPRTEKTVGYRVYYRRAAGRGCVLKDVAWEDFANLKCIEQTPGFLRWIDTEWQYDEVEL